MDNNKIKVYSYGKINLSLDVLGTTDDGYHEVEMIMQAILLHDDVFIEWEPGAGAIDDVNRIELHTDLPYVPDDERNIAYKAAILMFERFPENRGRVRIDIKKRIPVAAGLAGGSGNGAAVVMGLAKLWDLGLQLEELMELGAQLGSDVPFSVMTQAACNGMFGYKGEKMAATCALAKGRGTELTPLTSLRSWVLLAKPPLSVSTAEVYKGIDSCEITERPDNKALADAIATGDTGTMKKNMINVLEKYTLQRYDRVYAIKDCIKNNTENDEIVLMTGSGPTVFALCASREDGKRLAGRIGKKDKQVILTRTLV
jgi:4-diphosphocytidyl-2-C-methyl-D-erythritol kinase